MTLIFARHPVLWVLLALSILLCFLAATATRGGLFLTLSAGLCVTGMIIAALACSVPYTELLILLLAPLLVCFFAFGKGDRP